MPTDTLKIPDSVTYHGITYMVTSIGAYSFYNCIGLTQVTIPNTITTELGIETENNLRQLKNA